MPRWGPYPGLCELDGNGEVQSADSTTYEFMVQYGSHCALKALGAGTASFLLPWGTRH